MALIFNSVTQFVIQPERTKKRVKRDDLDTLSEIWTGPSALEDSFVPVIGTGHPDFALMTVISTSVKRLPMYVSEVTIQYQGKLDNYGGAQYTSPPSISQHWAEGEVMLGSSGAMISRRYTGRCVEVAYLTNRRPTGNPTNIGMANEFLGFTNVWDQVVSSGPGTAIIAPPITRLACTDVRVEDKADGWYRVTETYQSRMYPGQSITGMDTPAKPQPAQGPIAVTNWFVQPLGDTGLFQLDPTGKMGQSQQTTGAAKQAAASKDKTLETGIPPSVLAELQGPWSAYTWQDTFQQVGVNPGWFTADTPGGTAQTQQADFSPILSAAAAGPGLSVAELASAAITSAPLEY